MQVVILAGGSGTRFWPLSRQKKPKQLLALEGNRSLLQRTFDRLSPTVPAEAVWVVTTAALADAVSEQLPEVSPGQVLAEPQGRNTAAAIGWAVRSLPEAQRRGVVAVLPADHRMADGAGFRRVLEQAAQAVAELDTVMTLGIRPHRPETGYGYLKVGGERVEGTGLRKVERLCEKPDLKTAERFLASGDYLWNAGIFLFRGETLLRHLRTHLPALHEGLEAMAAAPDRLSELYGRLPAVSIDVGLMEKLDDIVTLPLDCGWSDLGSWEALAEQLPADEDGNVRHGEVLAFDAQDNLLWAEQGTIAVVGIQGLVVVRTGDSVLVIPKNRSQEVRRLVDELKAQGRTRQT